MNVLKINPLAFRAESACKQLHDSLCQSLIIGRGWVRRAMSASAGELKKSYPNSANGSKTTQQTFGKSGSIRLEISQEKLQRLLSNRQVCAADFHCLDEESHRCVREMCLKNCLRSSPVSSVPMTRWVGSGRILAPPILFVSELPTVRSMLISEIIKLQRHFKILGLQHLNDFLQIISFIARYPNLFALNRSLNFEFLVFDQFDDFFGE